LAATPPKGADPEENDMELYCTKFKAQVDVGKQLKTEVVLDVTEI
jgi:hypothetical protein